MVEHLVSLKEQKNLKQQKYRNLRNIEYILLLITTSTLLFLTKFSFHSLRRTLTNLDIYFLRVMFSVHRDTLRFIIS